MYFCVCKVKGHSKQTCRLGLILSKAEWPSLGRTGCQGIE